MNTNTLNSITLILATSTILSACGGDSDDTSFSGNNATTANSINFPASWFALESDADQKKFINEIQISNRNNSLSIQANIIFQQQGSQPSSEIGEFQYILTKDKLYYNKDGDHPSYLIQDKDSFLETSYEANGQGLKTTINYKIIPLANKAVTDAAVRNSLFDPSNATDSNYLKLQTAFQNTILTFDKQAECYQYLSTQNNQETISFDENQVINKTLEQWIADKKNNHFEVIEDTWAGYRVASVKESENSTNYHDNLVVEVNGKLYFSYYDGTQLNDHSAYYDDIQAFKGGICNLYNPLAANTLRTTIQGLPRN